MSDLLQSADVIIWLDLHWTLCCRRIVLRHVRADLARSNSYPGFLNMFRFAKKVRPYYLDPIPAVPSEANDDGSNRAAVAQVLSPYLHKTIHCRRPADVAGFLSQIKTSQRDPTL